VHLHTADGPFLLRETLTTLAETLPTRNASCACTARRSWPSPEVTALERRPSGDYELRLRDGARVPMSRTHKAEFTARWR
jgi:DNA-binding LytR/AlgR family response regulator